MKTAKTETSIERQLPHQAPQTGELTFKQAGVMLLVISAGLIIAEVATGRSWVWRGIPVIFFGIGFGALGLVALIYGIIKKS